MVAGQDQLDVVLPFQPLKVLRQIIHFVLVLQQDGNGAIIRLGDQRADPIALLIGVVAIADDEADPAAVKDVAVRRGAARNLPSDWGCRLVAFSWRMWL